MSTFVSLGGVESDGEESYGHEIYSSREPSPVERNHDHFRIIEEVCKDRQQIASEDDSLTETHIRLDELPIDVLLALVQALTPKCLAKLCCTCRYIRRTLIEARNLWRRKTRWYLGVSKPPRGGYEVFRRFLTNALQLSVFLDVGVREALDQRGIYLREICSQRAYHRHFRSNDTTLAVWRAGSSRHKRLIENQQVFSNRRRAVSWEWVLDCIQSGKRLPRAKYPVRPLQNLVLWFASNTDPVERSVVERYGGRLAKSNGETSITHILATSTTPDHEIKPNLRQGRIVVDRRWLDVVISTNAYIVEDPYNIVAFR